MLKTLLAYLFFKRFVKPCYIQWKYSRQGVPFWSSVPKPFIGDTLEFAKRVDESPDRPHFFDLVKDRFGEEIPPCFTLEHANPVMKLETFEYNVFQLAPPEIHFTFKRRAV